MSYRRVSDHRRMVFDDVRNPAYETALKSLITPETVVLDLGAGLGILGLMAAKLGARHVYLVEPEPLVNLAGEVARLNGLQDRITILQGRIEDVELPEKVDLIISVFTGNLLYSEDLLPSLFLARDRWLKPDGRLLPDKAQLCLAPYCDEALHAEFIGQWSDPSRALDLGSFERFAANEIIWLSREELRGELLGEGVVISEINLQEATSADCSGKAVCPVTINGPCHGLLGWIRMRLGDSWLSTSPLEPATHWKNALLPLQPPLNLQAGDAITIDLQRPVHGDWHWQVISANGKQRHSTFLSHPEGPAFFARQHADAKATLSRRGKATGKVLELIASGHTNGEIASQLLDAFPDLFGDTAAARQFALKIMLDCTGP
jgi:SAM-dependent methyltransferase